MAEPLIIAIPKGRILKALGPLFERAGLDGLAHNGADYIHLLAEIINNSDRPVQFIFAGKAHPADEPGKHILQRIHKIAHEDRFMGRIVFLEDYDINLARHLVQGVDVWLNNPRRPLEASGTSGQKVVLNGGLNLSILDGWWAEAYDGQNGFAIGGGETHSDVGIHDARDADALLHAMTDALLGGAAFMLKPITVYLLANGLDLHLGTLRFGAVFPIITHFCFGAVGAVIGTLAHGASVHRGRPL